MFCLETVKLVEVAFNPIGCPCQYKSHGSCLQAWFEQKQQYECPICHTVSISNPTQPVVRIVYVQREQEVTRIPERHQKCVGYCCLGIVFWVIFINILDYILYRR